MSYPVPSQQCETLYEIKKSKFIARAVFADTRQAAMRNLAQAKQCYPDARHHCWAYLLGHPASASSVAMSDDGEPSGTAGKPILNVLQHKGVGNIMLVVSRYFGGIKLGAGGLVRAYSKAAQQVMEHLPTHLQITRVKLTLHTAFKYEQHWRNWVSQHHGQIQSCTYSDQVTIDLSIPQADLPAMTELAHNLASRIST